MPRGLYLLTPDDPDSAAPAARVRPLLPARGAAAVPEQAGSAAVAPRASARAAPLRAPGVPLVVNDDWRLAADSRRRRAPGRHDGERRDARAALAPGAIIGVSCYDDLDRARAAADAGADYLAFGAFFPSGTKPLARRAPTALLRGAARSAAAWWRSAASRRTMRARCSPPAPTCSPCSAASSTRRSRSPPRAPSNPSSNDRDPDEPAAQHALFERAQQLMPGGVNSPVRAFKSVGGEPFFAAARRRRVPRRRRRQPLRRLRRQLGPDDRRPRASATCSTR
jgi:hypothetical protein